MSLGRKKFAQNIIPSTKNTILSTLLTLHHLSLTVPPVRWLHLGRHTHEKGDFCTTKHVCSAQCESAQSTCCTQWQKCKFQMGKLYFPWYRWSRNAIHLKEVSNLYNSKMSNEFDIFYQVFVDFCLIISLLLHQSVRPFPDERRVSARTTLRSGGLRVGNLETTWG